MYRLGCVLGFASSPTRTPHGVHVRGAQRNQTERHWGEIERLTMLYPLVVLGQLPLKDVYTHVVGGAIGDTTRPPILPAEDVVCRRWLASGTGCRTQEPEPGTHTHVKVPG